MSSSRNFTPDEICHILCEIIKALASPENYIKLNEAKEAAGNEMLKMMQIIFPMVVQIEMDIIKNHGFAAGRDGMVHFTQVVRDLEGIDPEVARLHGEIRSHFLPPVSIKSAIDASM